MRIEVETMVMFITRGIVETGYFDRPSGVVESKILEANLTTGVVVGQGNQKTKSISTACGSEGRLATQLWTLFTELTYEALPVAPSFGPDGETYYPEAITWF